MSSSVATKPSAAPSASPPGRQERSMISRILSRPEVGALAAAIAIFIFFYAVAPPFRTLPALATVLYASSTIGIVAVGVALLMIGGEFDLSAGVMVTTAALASAMICYQLSLNMWVGVVVSLLIALAIGFVNGYLVVRTGIPSFLITLSTFFILQGLNLGVTKLVTGTVATPNTSGLDGFGQANAIFASDINLGFIGLKAFAAAVLGGFGSIPGALFGGLTIGLIELFAGAYLPHGVKDVAAYVVLLTVLAVRPQGMFGTLARKKV